MTKHKAFLLIVVLLLGWSTENGYAQSDAAISRDTVKKAQKQLKDKGYYQGSINGVLGPNTREALRGYQEKENLNADGRLTRETADSLGIRKSSDSTVDDHFEAAGERSKRAKSPKEPRILAKVWEDSEKKLAKARQEALRRSLKE